jgi:large subunit ribosomal protein L24
MSIARIKKHDTVIVISGDYAGQTGKVTRIDLRKNVVFVEGLNLVKKAVRRSQIKPEGGFVEIEAPIRLSKVMPYDAEAKKGVRIRRVRTGDTPERVSKATNKVLHG